ATSATAPAARATATAIAMTTRGCTGPTRVPAVCTPGPGYPGRMKACLGAACLGLVVFLAAAAPAGAAKVVGWDGSNPFDCVTQNVGFGTNFPDPDADPFCVEFDKRRQNVTELGVVDFLSQEPARVA